MANFFNNGGFELVLGSVVLIAVLFKAAYEEKKYDATIKMKKN